MDPKPRPNHKLYIEALRRMTPAQRMEKAFELSELGRKLFEQGLRKRFPDLSKEEFQALLRKRLDLCHNSNW
jgi:DNA-binding PadR family transcriptional regulator